jgi:hypothetical protein
MSSGPSLSAEIFSPPGKLSSAVRPRPSELKRWNALRRRKRSTHRAGFCADPATCLATSVPSGRWRLGQAINPVTGTRRLAQLFERREFDGAKTRALEIESRIAPGSVPRIPQIDDDDSVSTKGFAPL